MSDYNQFHEENLKNQPILFKRKVVSTFHNFKFKFHDEPERFNIPVYDKGKIVCILRPISAAHGDIINKKDIIMLTNWRNLYKKHFLTWFTATEERTRSWLMEQVILRDDRILFMVETPTGEPFGHMGLTNFDFLNRSCEYDNIVRGERLGPQGGITLAGQTLLKWAFSCLGVRKVLVRVFEDNFKAIRLYERLGFKPVKKVPLQPVRKGEEICWMEVSAVSGLKGLKYLLYMEKAYS